MGKIIRYLQFYILIERMVVMGKRKGLVWMVVLVLSASVLLPLTMVTGGLLAQHPCISNAQVSA